MTEEIKITVPYLVRTKNRYIVLQATDAEHAKHRFDDEYRRKKDEEIVSIKMVRK